MNSMAFDYSEDRAYNLLQRLIVREVQRKYAVGMLSAAYKLKIIRRKAKTMPSVSFKKEIKFALREFSKWEQKFVQQNKSIKNMGD